MGVESWTATGDHGMTVRREMLGWRGEYLYCEPCEKQCFCSILKEVRENKGFVPQDP